jgi:hypothetical protein
MTHPATSREPRLDIVSDRVERTPSNRDDSKGWWRMEVTAATFVMGLLLTVYAIAFYQSIGEYWFHPGWTTDDAVQQVYPLHVVKHPGIFEGDLTTEVMKGYLAPAHYWLCYGVTMLTGDPIMMSHWVMLIQVVLTVGFCFVALRAAAGTAPAFFGLVWLLHSRNLMQRITGGLPRGWSPPIFCAFIYFALAGRHYAVLATILLGCLLNPPATMVVAVAYGLLLMWRFAVLSGESRQAYAKKLMTLALAAPIFAVTTLSVVERPESVGQMVTFEEASHMADFARPGGRFPFLPFNPALSEIRQIGFETFVGRFYNPHRFVRAVTPFVVVGFLATLVVIGWRRKRVAIPAEIVTFGIAALTVYMLSRILAFRLYVPNRHLQIPMAIFFIFACTLAAWRALHRGKASVLEEAGSFKDSRWRYAWVSMCMLFVWAGLVYAGSNVGLFGAANFNYARDKKGNVFEWLSRNTPESALIAGHPTHLDGVQLFAIRRGYVTTETTHPFYKGYYAEMYRRNEISLRAHYAASLEEVVSILEPEGITHFVFKRADFYPEAMRKVKFFPSYKPLLDTLTSRPEGEYAYRQLPAKVDMTTYPFMPYKDKMSVVIDVQALKTYLQSREAAAASLPVTQRKGTATKQVALALKASSSK